MEKQVKKISMTRSLVTIILRVEETRRSEGEMVK